MLSKLKLNQLYFKDTQFANLMTKRIFNVLLVANPYDAFMLEDDGRIDEKIFIEYMNLSLRYPPRFTQVSTPEETWKQLGNIRYCPRHKSQISAYTYRGSYSVLAWYQRKNGA